MALLGERVGAAIALEWGLINRVVPDDELERRGRRCCSTHLAQRPDQGLRERASGCSTAPSTPELAEQLDAEADGPARAGPDGGLRRGRARLRRETAAQVHRNLSGRIWDGGDAVAPPRGGTRAAPGPRPRDWP